MPSIADIRTQYAQQSLLESDVLSDAIDQFQKWWDEVIHSEATEANAMTLATASKIGEPDARIVLLKGFSKKGFVFFTNYESQKGKELTENPQACLVFFWKELERQVRIKGRVVMVSAEESDEYYFSRPEGSQLGAWVSKQSSVLKSREELTEIQTQLEKEVADGKKIERPEYWGGYIVMPTTIEFWQGRPNRLHDRLQYTIQQDGNWKIDRLSP
ncbi:MAG TPA: pyridoxamine 5'-phosphate oxidase [Niabella sp.]|nr:pyridoxamine 5'-phosphate oxidase [Niabella sp.]HQW14172.1 pyridoxamine 5'-phosphate oxidase [Niabella sp.]HQX19572.1 pyridoxamine 5'-phosphate oxidase [Niabella sp.]HQX39994.1 pyridoxamine 5'-phosphate oxidase [Niabella sp.]HRB06988.1 pyridoxamine 5'-phosphate oxidase [Niabella sp.]